MGEDLPNDVSKAQKSISAFKIAMGQLIADGFRAATRAAKEFLSDSISEFRAWEDVMTGVAKTTGLPKEAIEGLGASLRGIASDIGPIVAQDIGKVAEVAGQLGVASDKIKAGNFEAAIEEISGFAETISKAAIALPEFEGGAGQIATLISKQLNLYKEGTDSAEAFLSTMNELSNTTSANAAQIGEFLAGFTSAEALGIAQQQAAAIGATFVSLGQDAGASATRMTTAMSNIVDKGFGHADILINKSEESIKALEEISGKTLEEMGSTSDLLLAAMNEDIAGATLVVADALSEVEGATARLATSNDIFGKIGGRVMMAMSDNIGLYKTNLQTAQQATKEATEEVSSIQEEFEVALAKSGTAFDELQSKIVDVKIEVGTHLTKALSDVISTDLNPLIEQFGTWLKTSGEAKVLFQETLPDALAFTITAVKGIAEVALAAKNGFEIAGETVGTIIGNIDGAIATLRVAFRNLKRDVDAAFDAVVAKAEEVKYAVEDVVSVIPGMGEEKAATLEFDAQDALDTLAEMRGELENQKEIFDENQKLADKYRVVWKGMQTAIGDNLEPSKKLKEQWRELQNELIMIGEVGYGSSVWPDTCAWIQKTTDEAEELDEGVGSITDSLSGLGANLGTLSSGMGKLGDLFGIKELSGAGSILGSIQEYAQIPALLGDMGGALSGILGGGGLGGAVSALSGGLGGLGGAASGLVSSLGGVAAALGPIGIGAGVAGAAIYGLVKAFGKSESGGHKAARRWQDFVGSTIEGGGALKEAMKGVYESFDFKDQLAGFDEMGMAVHNTLNGFSESWETGTSGMDRFGQAIWRMTGKMKESPQVAFQTIQAMQEMGMSIDEIAMSMGEMVSEANQSNLALEQSRIIQDMLADSANLTTEQIEALEAALSGVQAEADAMEAIDIGAEFGIDTSATTAGMESLRQHAQDTLQAMQASAIQTAEDMRALGASEEEVTAKLRELGLTNEQIDQRMTELGLTEQQIIDKANEMGDSLNTALSSVAITDTSGLQTMTAEIERLAASGQISEISAGGLSQMIAQIGADGQITAAEITGLNERINAVANSSSTSSGALSTLSGAVKATANELGSLASESTGAKLTVSAVSSQIDTLAGSGQYSEEVIAHLKDTMAALSTSGNPAALLALQMQIDALTGSSAALDNELVGQSLVPSLAMLGASSISASSGVLQLSAATVDATEKSQGMEVAQQKLSDALGGVQTGAGSADGSLRNMAASVAEAAGVSQGLESAERGVADAMGQANTAVTSITTETGLMNENLVVVNESLVFTGEAAVDFGAKSREPVEGVSTGFQKMASKIGQAKSELAGLIALMKQAPEGMPSFASGGRTSGGFAMVGERGPEGAKFPGGRRGVVGLHGPEVRLFPTGTQIIPNTQLSSFLRSIPRMAAGGTVQAAPIINVSISGNTISNDIDMRRLADRVSQEIASKIRPYMR